jgi:hypothetical protein
MEKFIHVNKRSCVWKQLLYCNRVNVISAQGETKEFIFHP